MMAAGIFTSMITIRSGHQAGSRAEPNSTITNAGTEVAKAEVRLSEGALRHIGDYEVTIDLHTDVVAIVKLSVVAE